MPTGVSVACPLSVPSDLYPSTVWVCVSVHTPGVTCGCPRISYCFVCVGLSVHLPLGPCGLTLLGTGLHVNLSAYPPPQGMAGAQPVLEACLSLCVPCVPLGVSTRLHVSRVSKSLPVLGCHACHCCVEGQLSLLKAAVWGRSSVLLGRLGVPGVGVWVSLFLQGSP